MSVAGLYDIYVSLRPHPEFAADCVWALRQLDAEKAWRAAWLLKRLAQDGRLSDAELGAIAELSEEVNHWLARLMLCQLFAAAGCPDTFRGSLYPYLRECAGDQRVIVRAWAITALLRFRTVPGRRAEVDSLLRAARLEPSKAMRARLRRLPLRPEERDAARRARRSQRSAD